MAHMGIDAISSQSSASASLEPAWSVPSQRDVIVSIENLRCIHFCRSVLGSELISRGLGTRRHGRMDWSGPESGPGSGGEYSMGKQLVQ
jgi:hypothetical protein